MDALLPSEIARLVLGYLQENKCEEAAKMFLETSPHLQECRLVAQRGGRYSTKVGGLSLTDMLDKYCAANAIVQEKLNKVSDSEQIKNCNDITEQLRYLLEGSRGHRFVVNINVPTQNSPNGSFGTPIISTSSRKRHHSGGSDRGKRVVKSLNNLMEKESQASSGQNFETVEATPLESLPGHKPSAKQSRIENNPSNLTNKSPSKIASTQNVPQDSRPTVSTSIGTQSELNRVSHTLKHQSTETISTSNLGQSPSKIAEQKSSEPPINYCSTEVQTAPIDLFDAEHDVNFEPIANLSLLTEELLNRTELAQQIAENINKSIIPIQENAHDNPEANLSLLQGFDNAVKSAVETTDKVLEGLFNEIFTIADNDTNLAKNSDERNVESMDVDNDNEFISHQTKRSDVPLKQRLRSSSRPQINPDEDARDCNALLDNQNEEAIRSIVANVMASKQSTTGESVSPSNSSPNDVQPSALIFPDEAPSTGNENVEPNKNANNAKPTKPKKNPRKPRTPKQKEIRIQEQAEEIKLQEQNIVTMPTLILCSQNDMTPGLLSMRGDGYVPIAPKPLPVVEQDQPPSQPPSQPAPHIFLRTVHVPRHLMKPSQLEAASTANQMIMQMQASPQKHTATSASCSGSPIVVIADDKQQQQKREVQQRIAESITLYGDDSNSEMRLPAPVTSMPMISLDESACPFAGTGLSPFFKGSVNAETTVTQAKDDEPKTVHMKEPVEEKEITCASDDSNKTEKIIDEIEKELEPTEIEQDKEINQSKTSNPTIVVTAPDEDETVSTEKIIPMPKVSAVENVQPEEQSTDVDKKESTSKVKESKKDDNNISSKGASNADNEQSTDVNKGSKDTDKKDTKLEEKSIVSKKDTKLEEKSTAAKKEEKSIRVKKDTARENKSIVPVKKDTARDDKSIVPVKKDTARDDKSIVKKKSSKLEEKPSDDTRIKENARTADAIITKRTPKSLLKDRSKNNRLSLSTPRRRNSHVRALDFDEKTPEHNVAARKVPQSCTRPKSSAVQGLFQSPPFSGETPPVTLAEPVLESKPVRTHVSVPPIATRSPAPKLQGNWNKVAGIGLILGESESSPEKSQPSLNLSTIAEKKEPPKSWDSDLRKIVGEVNEDEEKRPKSAKKCRRRNSIKGKPVDEVTQPKSAQKLLTPGQASQDHLKITPPPASLMTKINVPPKTSPEMNARFRDLQTPNKVEMLTVPATPRVMFATPGGACLVKVSSGKEIIIKDCVSTPDFPPTPCIVLTPKIVEEEEHEKKPSPYYEPSEETTHKDNVSSEKIMVQKTATTVTIQRKNIVELQESKTVEITKFGVVEENMARKAIIKEVESTSEENSKEIIEEDSMEETNASIDTANTDSESDSDSDSNSSTSSSSSNSSSNSSSCSSNASSPTKSINVSHHDNSTTESEVDSPQKVLNSREELERVAERSPEKEILPSKVIPEVAPAEKQLTSTISAIIANEKPLSKASAKPKIINVQRVEPPSTKISEKLSGQDKLSLQLEEKRQRVMAKCKQNVVNSKRTVTIRRVTAMKKPETMKNVVKQTPAKKVKPIPKKKIPVVNNGEEAKPKNLPENEKENQKAKVDQVKRDLFAPGDEAEQRTTRSQSARKSIDENPPLPGVLECLQLIPANKSADETLDQTVDGLSNNQTNSLEVSFVYDDSVPIKKRKRNYSSSELENEYAFTFPDEDEVRIMKVQPYEEIFKMAPKPVKKKSPKKSPIKVKRKITRCPLAASSPLKKDKLQKRNSTKRKASPIKEEKQIEKKMKEEGKGITRDPQALFKNIDLDKFLKTIHVSE